MQNGTGANRDSAAMTLSPAARWVVLATLMVTQTFGWGTGLSLLGVMGQAIGSDLGLSPGMVFSAAIVLYGAAAVMAPSAGRLADRHGGAILLAPGAALTAVALALLSIAQGPVSYFASWGLQGLAMHFMLLTACYTAITQIWGQGARRVIGMLTLATGLCSTVFWPLTQYLKDVMDWREVTLVYAAATAFGVVPVNLILARVLRRHQRLSPPPPGPESPEPAPQESAGSAMPLLSAGAEHQPPKGSFGLLAILFALSAAIGNAVGILIIDMFFALGLGREDAVHAASLVGIAFLIARGAEIAFGNRINPVRMSILVFCALPLPFVVMLGWSMVGGALPLWLAALVALAYGAPQGLSGLMRPALVQHIFGTRGYGTRLGRLSRVSDVASAVTPALLAAVIAQSVTGAVVLVTCMALSCAVLVLWLSRLPCPDHVTLKECPPCP